jgi:hypothetical protein
VAAAAAAKVYSWLHQEEKSRNALSSHPVIQRYVADAALVHVCTELWQTGFRPNQVRSYVKYCLELRDRRRRLFATSAKLLRGAKTELDGEHLSCLDI